MPPTAAEAVATIVGMMVVVAPGSNTFDMPGKALMMPKPPIPYMFCVAIVFGTAHGKYPSDASAAVAATLALTRHVDEPGPAVPVVDKTMPINSSSDTKHELGLVYRKYRTGFDQAISSVFQPPPTFVMDATVAQVVPSSEV